MAVARKMTPFDYVLLADREKPADEQTTWNMRPLTWAEMEEIEAATQFVVPRDGDGDIRYSPQQMKLARRVLSRGLTGWTNLRDEEGNQVEFQKASETQPIYSGKRKRRVEFLPDELLDMIADDAVELANAITSRSKLERETAKNSGSP